MRKKKGIELSVVVSDGAKKVAKAEGGGSEKLPKSDYSEKDYSAQDFKLALAKISAEPREFSFQ